MVVWYIMEHGYGNIVYNMKMDNINCTYRSVSDIKKKKKKLNKSKVKWQQKHKNNSNKRYMCYIYLV